MNQYDWLITHLSRLLLLSGGLRLLLLHCRLLLLLSLETSTFVHIWKKNRTFFQIEIILISDALIYAIICYSKNIHKTKRKKTLNKINFDIFMHKGNKHAFRGFIFEYNAEIYIYIMVGNTLFFCWVHF